MSQVGITKTCIATTIADAVRKDEAHDGCDLAAGRFGPEMSAWIRSTAAILSEPIDMVLHCPECGAQHIDTPERDVPMGRSVGAWTNPPHRTHLCHSCGHKWRPADVATNGVAAVKTRGKDDSPIAKPSIRPNPPPPQWMPIQGTPLAVRMSVLDDLTAYKNHRQNLVELADRGGMSPVEALALAKRLPLPIVPLMPPAISEAARNRQAVIALSEHGRRADEPKS